MHVRPWTVQQICRRSVVNAANVIRKPSGGFIYLDRAEFPRFFAADLAQGQVEFEAHSLEEIAAMIEDARGKPVSPALINDGCAPGV
jgi:hypothetical protein